ncbi:MAG TPA: DUF892 family protein [Opitutaceae bacterium]|nr:DUF892 family protein [Opitutaceae bacterium]
MNIITTTTPNLSPLVCLRDLLVEELRCLYHAESQLLTVFPKMAKAATHPELREAFEVQASETRLQLKRLEKIMRKRGYTSIGGSCEAMRGLITEVETTLRRDLPPSVKDLTLIGTAQKIAHYTMAGYSTANAFAELSGDMDTTDALMETVEDTEVAQGVLQEISARIEIPQETLQGAVAD